MRIYEIKTNAKKKRGFTLVELLVVITIIGVLASLILVSLQKAKVKARKTSALASLASVMGELSVCDEDSGEALGGSAPTSATPICCEDDTCAAALSGHSQNWPDISATGFSYDVPANSLLAANYTYSASNPDGEVVSCDFSTKACQ